MAAYRHRLRGRRWFHAYKRIVVVPICLNVRATLMLLAGVRPKMILNY
jgi:hypothetical protein